MKCIVCEKELEPELNCDKFQPGFGSEIQIIPAYGSRFDEIWGHVYRGVICDKCHYDKFDLLERYRKTKQYEKDPKPKPPIDQIID
jgi:hypothetical protein